MKSFVTNYYFVRKLERLVRKYKQTVKVLIDVSSVACLLVS